jgi:hypothetical protein
LCVRQIISVRFWDKLVRVEWVLQLVNCKQYLRYDEKCSPQSGSHWLHKYLFPENKSGLQFSVHLIGRTNIEADCSVYLV